MFHQPAIGDDLHQVFGHRITGISLALGQVADLALDGIDLDLVAGAQVTPNATWGPEQATCAADYVLRKAAEAYSTHKPLPLSHADVDADAKQAAAEMMVGDSAAAPSILSAEQAAALVTDAWFTAPAALARRPAREVRDVAVLDRLRQKNMRTEGAALVPQYSAPVTKLPG